MGYADTLKVAEAAGNTAAVAELKSLAPYPADSLLARMQIDEPGRFLVHLVQDVRPFAGKADR